MVTTADLITAIRSRFTERPGMPGDFAPDGYYYTAFKSVKCATQIDALKNLGEELDLYAGQRTAQGADTVWWAQYPIVIDEGVRLSDPEWRARCRLRIGMHDTEVLSYTPDGEARSEPEAAGESAQYTDEVAPAVWPSSADSLDEPVDLDPEKSSADIMLDAAHGKLQHAVVMGYAPDGQLYLASTLPDAESVLLAERMKHFILSKLAPAVARK